MRGFGYAWAMGVLAVIGMVATPGRAGVSKTGDTYDDLSSFYAGYHVNATGSLTIDAGSAFFCQDGYLGYAAGSTGAATVTGAGSKWTNSGTLIVGEHGSGMLRVEAGAEVNNTAGYVGLNFAGTAIVTGAGSKWTNSAGLMVSVGGSGTLTVSDGGVVSAPSLVGSLSDLYGDGTITIQSGGVLDADLAFDAAHGLTQTLAFGTGGTLQFTVDGTSDLGVGWKQSGSLRIAEGRSVTSTRGQLGNRPGSSGTAIVTGAGSKWNNSWQLYVGGSGSGTLRVEAGAQVSDNWGYLGDSRNSTGAAVITGVGSKWTNSAELYVGYSGSGTLNVEAGAQVSNTLGYLGYSDSGSVGGAIVTGAGSKWANSGEFYVGYKGSGTLQIEAGGEVSNTDGYMGYNSGSTGTATISGDGSKWTNSGGLRVGYSGSGTLRVEAGAQVSNTLGYLGYNSGSTGAAIITGAGSKWINSGNLSVGSSGSGTLRVEGGGQVRNSSAYLGYSSGSTGTATITGAGSTWINSDKLYVGTSGGGTLRVEGGGQVSSKDGYLGYNFGCTGTATISGAGSTWTNSGTLYVGYNGSGTLAVSDGGIVSTGTLYASLSDLYGNGGIAVQSGAFLDGNLIFDASHGAAQMVPFGTGGTLQLPMSGTLGVGYRRSGSLRIDDGRSITSGSGYLGYNSGSTGTAVVTGAGSKWTSSSSLSVGQYGSGTLTVSDGGQVTAMSLNISNQSTVRLHVSGDRMLVLGSASTIGSVSNSGKVSLLADAFLPAGTYKPIGEYAGRNMSWSGFGSTLAVGGTWNSSAKTFTVIAPALVDAGTSAAVASGRRLLISDLDSGERAGVCFGTLSSGTRLSALPVTTNEQTALMARLDPKEMVLSGWDFAGQLAGGEALVSFDVGTGAEGLRVWRRSQSGWSVYAAEMMTYDSKGIVSFTVDPAALNGAGYAVSGVVPEPGGVGVLAVAAVGLLRRRRVRSAVRR